MINIKNQLNDYLVGSDLITALTVLPSYKNELLNPADRLMALLDIYKIFIPSKSTIDIYNRLYMAIMASLEKKQSIEETKLLNDNFRTIKCLKRYGVIGGLESFKITGRAGLGKTSNVQRCTDLISGNKIIVNDNPYREIIPVLFVECVADGSFKSLLYQILIQVDELIGSTYFVANRHQTTTVDSLLAAVANVLTNHVCLLVIDEIERVANDSKKGETLINYLTQLVNQSNISICFVGNESANRYFETKEYMSRRTIGISITKMDYDEYFYNFVRVLFDYQYVLNKVECNSELVRTFYKLTNGIPSMVVSLFVESQRSAIIEGKEKLDIKIIEETFNSNFKNMFSYIDCAPTKPTKTSHNQSISNNVGSGNKNTKLFEKVSQNTNMEVLEYIEILKQNISLELVKL